MNYASCGLKISDDFVNNNGVLDLVNKNESSVLVITGIADNTLEQEPTVTFNKQKNEIIEALKQNIPCFATIVDRNEKYYITTSSLAIEEGNELYICWTKTTASNTIFYRLEMSSDGTGTLKKL